MGRSNVAFRNGAVGIMSMVRLMIVIVGDYFGIVVGGFTAKFDMGLCWLHLNRNRNYLISIIPSFTLSSHRFSLYCSYLEFNA
jgi:hypothetical protein